MKIKCPACNAILNMPAGAAGKVVKCPCGKQLRPAIAGLVMGIIALIAYTILANIGVAAQLADMPDGPFNQ